MSKGHHHGHNHNHNDVKNIKVAFLLNFTFTIIEIIGGILTNSVAILSDALHDLGDSLSLALAWYFQKLSKKGRDKSFSYGYKRFSLLGAIINSVVLLAGSTYILTEAIPRLISPQAANAKGMVLLAILGIIANGAAVLRLKRGDSINEKVVSLHLMEDLFGWVAVMIGAIIMYFFDVPIIDPILSVLITVYVLLNVFKNLKQSFNIILQGIPIEIDSEEITSYLLSINKVSEIHDLHIWTMDGKFNILTVHLVLNTNMPFDAINLLKKEIRDKLSILGINHSTIEFESEAEKCLLEEC